MACHRARSPIGKVLAEAKRWLWRRDAGLPVAPARARRDSVRRFVGPAGMQRSRREGDLPVAARTVEVDLPAQTTLDQAIVALLKLRRGDVPGDATLEQAAALRFDYTISEEATPAVPPEDLTREE